MARDSMQGASLVDAVVVDSLFGVGGSPFYEHLYGLLIYSVRAVEAERSDEWLSLGRVAALVSDEKRLDALMAAESSSEAGRSARQWYRQVWLVLQPVLRLSVVQAFGIIGTGRFLIEPVGGGRPVTLADRTGPWSRWSLKPFSERVKLVAAAVARGEHPAPAWA